MIAGQLLNGLHSFDVSNSWNSIPTADIDTKGTNKLSSISYSYDHILTRGHENLMDFDCLRKHLALRIVRVDDMDDDELGGDSWTCRTHPDRAMGTQGRDRGREWGRWS